MKKLSLLAFVLLVLISSSFAQTSFFAGLNATGSMNVGFWGGSAMIEAQHQLTSRVKADLSLNGFHDLAPRDKRPGIEAKDYHRSISSTIKIY